MGKTHRLTVRQVSTLVLWGHSVSAIGVYCLIGWKSLLVYCTSTCVMGSFHFLDSFTSRGHSSLCLPSHNMLLVAEISISTSTCHGIHRYDPLTDISTPSNLFANYIHSQGLTLQHTSTCADPYMLITTGRPNTYRHFHLG